MHGATIKINMTQEYFDVFRYQEMWLSSVWSKYLIYGTVKQFTAILS